MNAATQRFRAFSERRRRGIVIVPTEIEESAFVAALRSRGIVSADAKLGRAELSAHAAAVLALWAGEPKEQG